MLAVYANWGFARIKGVGWGWAGVVWIYSVVFYVPLDFLKFAVRYILSGKAWDNLLERKASVYMLYQLNFTIVHIYKLCFITSLHGYLNELLAFEHGIDCLHNQEGLWPRGKGGTMGTCSEDFAWTAAT